MHSRHSKQALLAVFAFQIHIAKSTSTAGAEEKWFENEHGCDDHGNHEDCILSLRQLRARKSLPVLSAEAAARPPWKDSSLASPSSAPLLTFYMYRAVKDQAYPPENVNSASLPGVLWYLHHEVVIQAPRKFDIVKILRFKVQMKATEPLVRKNMNFGARFAFDEGENTGPFACGRTETSTGPTPSFCNGQFSEEFVKNFTANYTAPYEWSQYGYFVGCNNLGEYPFPMFPVNYTGAVWYSLPGTCPSKKWNQKSKGDMCMMSDPGGFCPGVTPTGAGDCTWNYELAGEITIDELVGIKDYWTFVHSGKREYNPDTDSGIGFSWWNSINDTKANAERVRQAQNLFKAKYPTLEANLPDPQCDFNFGRFYKEFFLKDAQSGPCQIPKPGDGCYEAIQWAKSDGIHAHPAWYDGLTPQSSVQDFQRNLFQQGQAGCLRPC